MKSLLLFILFLPALTFAQVTGRNYQEEIDTNTEIIKSDSKNINAYANRAGAELALKEYQLAIQDYEVAISLEKKYPWIYYNNIGIIKEDMGDLNGALESFTIGIQLNRENGIYTNRAPVWFELKDYNAAITDYTTAIAMVDKPAHKRWGAVYMSQLIDYYIARGQIKLVAKDDQGALEDFNEVLTLSPKNAKGYNGRGTAKNHLGDKQGACSNWNKAVSLKSRRAAENIARFCN
jgi:tetratricopeptide (TPR) repeat protein